MIVAMEWDAKGNPTAHCGLRNPNAQNPSCSRFSHLRTNFLSIVLSLPQNLNI